MASSSFSGYYYSYHYSVFLAVLTVVLLWGSQSSCEASGTFGFDVHHRYSDPVRGILDLDGLPEKGSGHYFAAMAHRDRIFHGRRLAGSAASPVIFSGGNETYRFPNLGFLHYANVSVGTPSLSFLVALDTGSDLFWLPCDCISCVNGFRTRNGQEIDFNIYSPNTSSTSMRVPCNSTSCRQQRRCSANSIGCPYQVLYLSSNTSSNGVLVEDLLHLTTDGSQLQAVDARIKFGCGMIQTGTFLDGAAPNGLFGLGIENTSVPSILANEGFAANSFSMCFGPDGIGRIRFGDKGSTGQGETPFNLGQLHPTYNISITQISVEDNVTDLDFTAIFDSGTSFTYIGDPAYTTLCESFNSLAEEKRSSPDSEVPFEYCYDLSPNQTSFNVSSVSLTMKGGMQFSVTDPIVIISLQGGGNKYCLGVVKSGDVNIIGQNFMTGYNIIFDREKMVLGWKASDCYNGTESDKLPLKPGNSTAHPPTTNLQPETTGNRSDSPVSSSPVQPTPAGNFSPRLCSLRYSLLMVLFSVFSHYMIILSS